MYGTFRTDGDRTCDKISFVTAQVEYKIRFCTGGASMFTLYSCGYNDNGGGDGHCWDLNPALTPSYSSFNNKCWHTNGERNIDTLNLVIILVYGK